VRPTPYMNPRIHPRDAPFASNRLPAADNLYARPGMQNRLAATPARPMGRATARPSNGPNNVYADRQGNVFQKNGNQWNKRDNGAWRPEQPSARPESPGTGGAERSGTRNAPSLAGHGSLDREAKGRERSQYRSQEAPRVTRPPESSGSKPSQRNSGRNAKEK